MKSKIGKGLVLLGILCFIGAGAFAGYHVWDNYRAQKDADRLLYGLTEHMKEQAATPGVTNTAAGEMPATDIDGYRAVGTLAVPTLNLELPVTEQWDYEVLKKAACRYSGTAAEGNLIIMAHNYRRYFGQLARLSKGDVVQFLSVDGTLYQYRVLKVETLDNDALEALTQSGADLTLFTCTYSGRQRIVVRCERNK